MIDSDDDDIVKSTPDRRVKTTKKTVLTKRKVKLISSDSEDEKITGKSIKKSETKEHKMVPTTVDDYFRDEPVIVKWQCEPSVADSNKEIKTNFTKASDHNEFGTHADNDFGKTLQNLDKEPKLKKIKHKSKKSELDVHGDKYFEQTLEELDDNDLINNLDILDKTIEEATQELNAKEKNEEKLSNKISKEGSEKSQYECISVDLAIMKKRQRNDSQSEGTYLLKLF